MILRYLILATAQVILMIFQFLFSWAIALSVTVDGHLKFLPSLFEPTDTLAIGDHDYWTNEMAHTIDWPKWIRNYWLALNWGMRNPAYGFADLAGFDLYSPAQSITSGNQNIDVGDSGAVVGSGYRSLVNGDGKKYFEYRRVGRWNKNLVWYIQLGWSIPTDLTTRDHRHLCVYIRPFCKG